MYLQSKVENASCRRHSELSSAAIATKYKPELLVPIRPLVVGGPCDGMARGIALTYYFSSELQFIAEMATTKAESHGLGL